MASRMDSGLRTMWQVALRRLRLPALFMVLSVTAGCAGGGAMMVSTGQSFGPTVAFESVDGPPPQVFDRLVRALETESTARSFTIVSREAQASYRVRSYLSAQVRRGRTVIAWVWDVYDRDQERALRLSGEEPAGKGGRDAWASADDQLMRRIALAGLIGLNGLINGTAPAQNDHAPATPRSGPAVAQSDENRPESASGQMQTLAFSAH